jgi:hydroxymethylglutaryl-CoA lyase
LNLPSSLSVVDVTARDGLQLEPVFVPTEGKIRLIEDLAAAGLRRIEATSFVSPTVMPQLRDAEAVMRGLDRKPGVVYSALVPNRRGAERAIDAGVDALRVVISVTDAGNRRNLGRSVEESLVELAGIVALARGAGRRVELVYGLAFGCPVTGPVPDERVVDLVGRAADLGADEVFVADSHGFADPAQVQRLVLRLRAHRPSLSLGLHLHDTRGLALANALAAMTVGVTSFDASVGGLGAGGLGVPGAASGNVATEDLVNLSEQMGVATGVTIERLIRLAHRLRDALGHDLPGRVQAVGTRAQLFARIASAATAGPSGASDANDPG